MLENFCLLQIGICKKEHSPNLFFFFSVRKVSMGEGVYSQDTYNWIRFKGYMEKGSQDRKCLYTRLLRRGEDYLSERNMGEE